MPSRPCPLVLRVSDTNTTTEQAVLCAATTTDRATTTTTSNTTVVLLYCVPQVQFLFFSNFCAVDRTMFSVCVFAWKHLEPASIMERSNLHNCSTQALHQLLACRTACLRRPGARCQQSCGTTIAINFNTVLLLCCTTTTVVVFFTKTDFLRVCSSRRAVPGCTLCHKQWAWLLESKAMMLLYL